MEPERLGKYELVRHLASGGMASVYLARLSGLGGFERHVVLKTLRAEGLAEDDSLVPMFLDEARLVATLHHQHIAQVFEVGCEDSTYFLAMEYVHGETVRQVMETMRARGRRLPLDFSLSVICAVAAGLHHAHERRTATGQPLGIVHRDVTPSNVIASYDGSIKLIDFGIAKAAVRTTITRSGLIKGKVGYMAPEQVRGYRIDRRSDVFALGVLTYEMTTQSRAFDGASQFEALERTARGELVPPSQLVARYPRALEKVVMTALEVDPDDRYPDAEAMRADLLRVARDLGLALGEGPIIRVLGELFGAPPEPWLAPEDDDDEDRTTEPRELLDVSTRDFVKAEPSLASPTPRPSPTIPTARTASTAPLAPAAPTSSNAPDTRAPSRASLAPTASSSPLAPTRQRVDGADPSTPRTAATAPLTPTAPTASSSPLAPTRQRIDGADPSTPRTAATAPLAPAAPTSSNAPDTRAPSRASLAPTASSSPPAPPAPTARVLSAAPTAPAASLASLASTTPATSNAPGARAAAVAPAPGARAASTAPLGLTDLGVPSSAPRAISASDAELRAVSARLALRPSLAPNRTTWRAAAIIGALAAAAAAIIALSPGGPTSSEPPGSSATSTGTRTEPGVPGAPAGTAAPAHPTSVPPAPATPAPEGTRGPATPVRERVMLEVTTEPADATVVLDGVRLGRTPLRLEVPVKRGGAWLKVRKRRHVAVKIRVSLEDDVTWHVPLRAAR